MLKASDAAVIGPAAAATGLGGVGKTQAAIEFAHRYGIFFVGGVFWLSFENSDSIPSEIAQCGLAMNLRLDFSSLKLEDQVHAVRSAWESELPRLLIFDNCEDDRLLRAFRPVSGGSRVLVTSRQEQWSSSLDIRVVPLGMLSLNESVELLHKLNPHMLLTEDVVLRQISEEVGRLPLALHLVGSYLHTYRHVITSQNVLEELGSSNALAKKALTGEFGASLLTLPTKHDLNVYRTFYLSFSKLDQNSATDALAIQLLASAACLAPGESIPHSLLTRTALAEDATTHNKQCVEDALTRLANLGLLETSSIEPPMVRLHRLLVRFAQTTCQSILSSVREHTEQVVVAEADRLNARGFVKPLALWLVHLRYVTDTSVVLNSQNAADLSNELGNHLRRAADYMGAKIRFEQALKIDEATFGPNHPKVATHTNNLGKVLEDLGDYAGAKTRLEQALKIDEAAFRPDHPSVASALTTLAWCCRHLGDYAAQGLALNRP